MKLENGSWDENRKLVLSEIQDLKLLISEVRSEVRDLGDVQIKIREDIAGLKVRAGLIGGMTGAAASFLGHLFQKNP